MTTSRSRWSETMNVVLGDPPALTRTRALMTPFFSPNALSALPGLTPTGERVRG